MILLCYHSNGYTLMKICFQKNHGAAIVVEKHIKFKAKMIPSTSKLDCSCGFSTISYEEHHPIERSQALYGDAFEAYFHIKKMNKSPEIFDFTDEAELDQIDREFYTAKP